jgi:ubiquinone/menaquinone biosynthesis C-methylase UbiE
MQSACEALLPPIPATVLDPCGGSGTTAVAAEHLRRSWILCEASPEYCELARARVAAESAAPGPEPPALPDQSLDSAMPLFEDLPDA